MDKAADTVEQEIEEIEEIKEIKEVEEIAEITEITENAEEDQSNPERNLRKTRVGMVVSNKMDKTAVVEITERVKHSRYSKILKRSTKYKVHDEKNECDVGDKVLIMETRPLSKDKHFRLVEILEKVK